MLPFFVSCIFDALFWRAPNASTFNGDPHSKNGLGANQPWRSTISFLISPIACAGFSPLGQVRVQFMMV
jgi:hypothetical protein